MLSDAQNRQLTEVGPDTPAGRLFRSYWLPVALPEQLVRRNPLPVQALGEKLVLFRDRSGRLGLLDDRCAHRGTSLSAGSDAMKTAGRIDPEGIRCCYHGWLYGRDGQCLEMPGEPAGSNFAARIRIQAYRVQEAFGMIWAYMGEGEPPSLPPIDALARQDGHRVNTIGLWPCNFLQVAENMVDPVHVSVLHAETDFDSAQFAAIPTVRAEPTPSGLKTIAGRPGYEREVEFLFPAGVRLAIPLMRPGIQLAFWLLPSDDRTTISFHTWFVPMPGGIDDAERAARISRLEGFLYEFDGSDRLFHASKVNLQDKFACASQGVITDRSIEHLGTTDAGVLLLRRLFREAIVDVAAGNPPRGVRRDAAPAVIHFENVF